MKTVVIIPTYNEKENIERLINQILDLHIPFLSVVVVDDNSPDGTGSVVTSIAQKHKNVHLLLRKGNRGRGLAGKAGYYFALKQGANYIIEMDADFSHDPKYIPTMLEAIPGNDMVLGSRLVKGGKQIGRGIVRIVITYLANLYIRLMFNIKVRDCNSGYRCFTRNTLQSIVGKLNAKGPDIVQEVLYYVTKKKLRVKEIPITFADRTKGDSKLGLAQLFKGYITVLKLTVKGGF